jgi:hypothetical protein
MLDRDTAVRIPHSDTDSRTSVSMQTQGVELVLFFDSPMDAEKGPLREIRVLPGERELTSRTLRRLVPPAALYEGYARSVLMFRDDAVAQAQAIRQTLGVTRRGLGPDFYPLIAETYRRLEKSGEPHVVKAIAELHDVSISAASRWIQGARDAGELPQKQEEGS